MPATTGLIGDSTELSVDLLQQKHDGRAGVKREFTWPEVKQLVAANRLELLGRTTPKELAYRADMHEIRTQYGSVAAYIRQVKLAEFIADSSEQFLLIPNDYPYALPKDVRHYIVWSKTELTPGCVPDPDVEALVAARLGAQTDSAYEWVWFVNPPHLQSIPEVVHGHLIVRHVDLIE
ncbi:hypothetical protein GGH12_003112 [Coemansia sp. RSA 1822]|nr:hypothetical protein LPJ76_003007 [Coemansia sp. RSA 638]KAJ2126022.1 hypothetical protein IW147_000494 [Coemansia sp. RSA 720]KAJ2545813.1 hypothetical protein GGF49_000016 [Coemansia sp. RSA 1853]KAJ2562586.1 hypothetical protein GGH12_003112 [Coemansia sp. RSA 1822]